MIYDIFEASFPFSFSLFVYIE